MKIKLLCIGKTTDSNIAALCNEYLKRLGFYANVSVDFLELKKKNLEGQQLKKAEGSLILSKIEDNSTLILLDERGENFSSSSFSVFLQKRLNSSKEIVFVIGGAFGFSEEVYYRANFKMALSKMTFTHQMIRPIFIEQLYRGFTILRGEKYHH